MMSAATKSRRLCGVLGGLLAIACVRGAPAGAATVTPLDAIRAAAERAVLERIPAGQATIVTAGALDERLRLAPCGGPLEATLPAATMGAHRVAVSVRCTQGASWSVYVPVTVETDVPVLVLRQAAARGARLGPADVEVQTRRLAGLASAYVSDPRELEGRTLRRPLPAGAAVTAEALQPDVLVRRGQQVTLLASASGMEVRAPGRALADGHAAARIRVQNLSSLRVVEGVVESANVIRITP